MIRAVICDDEKAALTIISYFIQQEHLPIQLVGTAEDGRQALELIQREKPDLIFMDIQMPYMDGFEVLQRVSNSKVIIVTAYGSFEYAQRALRMDVSDIIAKPIELEQLRSAVTRAIGWNFTDNSTVNQILAYIHQHYKEKIELEDLSRETFCGESHIARLFKKYMGITILSYIHKVRIEKAKLLLQEEGLNIQEAAERCGYPNLNNFYKYFKQYAGMTPAAYVQKHKSMNKEETSDA